MATQKVVTNKTKTRVKKDDSTSDYMQCNICHGTGVQKKPANKKKKKHET